MKLNEIKKLDKFTVNNPAKDKITVSVLLVYRGSFNDERLVASKEFNVQDIKDKPLIWFDLYLGIKKDNTVKIAFIYMENYDLYFFEDDGEKKRIVKKTGVSYCHTDDYDEKYIIAVNIW